MIIEPKRIKVSRDSEIARILDEAKENPIILESNGDTFRLYYERTDKLSVFDSEKVKHAISHTAGSWADLDTDKMISDLYQARERGCRPMARP